MPLRPNKKKIAREAARNSDSTSGTPRFKFDSIPKVDTSDELLDIAFRRAGERADRVRGTRFSDDKLARSKQIEKVRITVIKDVVFERLETIFNSFPDFRVMSPFYLDLATALVDMEQFKRSLSAIRWSQMKLGDFWAIYNSKITKTQDIKAINPYRREFYGRIASIIKQIKSALACLEDCRRTFKQFPSIEESVPTIAIIGFPNVGKTTLLFKLTGSKPEIASYAFTTRNINVSHYSLKGRKVQVLDTPGTLNRYEKMNSIEKQAYLSMKYLANVLVYVVDPAESYPLDDQRQLFEDVKKFQKPIIVYVSKADIFDKPLIAKLCEEFHGTADPAVLKDKVFAAIS